MRCEPLMVLLGPNNHGKSNILRAIEFGLSTSEKPTTEDLFAFHAPEDDSLWVELTFGELTSQEQNTFNRHLLKDGSLRVRKAAKRTEDGGMEVQISAYLDEPTEPWLRAEGVDELVERDKAEKTPLKTLLPDKGRLTRKSIEEAQAKYVQEHRDDLAFEVRLGPLLGPKNVGGGSLPDFYLVPAVRDLTDELKVKNTTAFGRLLNRAVQEMAERDPKFRAIRESLVRLIGSFNVGANGEADRPSQLIQLEMALQAELQPWDVTVGIEVKPPDIERVFELGTSLQLDDGLRTLAELKGHGLQRAVIFAFLRAWAKLLRATPPSDGSLLPRKSSESAVFAVEEPEMFLHPHAQRRLARAIEEIAETPQHQVFLCSHSTHFIDMDAYRRICIVTKKTSQSGTRVRQCHVDLFEGADSKERKSRFHMASWINPDRGEMLFAKRVALVEGETEKAVLPFLARTLGCFDADVSVIDCGSKGNLPLYMNVANAFAIPYVVVHDEDPLPSPIPVEWDEDRKRAAQETFRLNQVIAKATDPMLGRIEVLAPDFEHVAGVSASQGKKKGKALAALDHLMAEGPDQVPERLKELVHVTYRPGA